MVKRPNYLTLKDLDQTAGAHTSALKQHAEHLTAAKDKLRQGIEAYAEARVASPDHRMTDREFTKLLGDLEAAFNHVASDAAAEGYILGRIPGFRLGYQLAGMMGMQTIPDVGLPGVPRSDLPVYAAVAMVDDDRAQDLVETMLEHNGVPEQLEG